MRMCQGESACRVAETHFVFPPDGLFNFIDPSTMIRHRKTIVWLIACLISVASCPAQEQFSSQELEFFEKRIRPVLVQHCYECHSSGSEKLQAGLLLDSRERLIDGGDSGPAILLDDVDGSLMIEAIRYESYEMPPRGKLADDDIAAIEKWVAMGAPWPDESAPIRNDSDAEFDLAKRKSEHWCWQSLNESPVPSVTDAVWPLQELDYYILAGLEKKGIQPAETADRESLVRRIYQDLIGLPPTPEVVQEFISDKSPGAIERLVDQLLNSPHFGERWGRHWLDLVRYAESRGHEFDDDSRNAYQYRDYVIRAFNADIPYDQLVREHIAGDLLASPRMNRERGFNESVLGTGFWFLGEWAHSPVDIRKDETDRFDNMIDVMSKTFLGLTVSCARCHDHKFDAIPTSDYYSLSGFLQSSDYRQVRFESVEHNREIAGRIDLLDREYAPRIKKQLDSQGLSVSIPADEDELSSVIAVDYRKLSQFDYLQDGFLFGTRPTVAGSLSVASQGDGWKLQVARLTGAASDSIWHGLKSINESGINSRNSLHKIHQSGRTLRTPTFKLQSGNVVCRVHGRGHVVACVDSHRLIAGPLHGGTIKKIEADKPWTRIDLSRYIGHRVHLEFTPADGAKLEVAWVLQGATPEQESQLETLENEMRVATDAYSKSIDRILSENTALADQINGWIAEWGTARKDLRSQIRFTSKLAIAMRDGTSENDQTLIRGDSSSPGSVSPRHFLTAVSGMDAMDIQVGSGRLQLAESINAASNPLTPRVIVNRVWHHLMGRGIVPTPDNFGVLGQYPSHPELLDQLALRFMEDGRSIKRLIRTIVMSRTYQMSSRPIADSLEADPKNQMWHYRPPRRLEGEAIRDQLLAISGRLDTTMFGEPIPIHLTPFMEGRGRPPKNGPLDGDGRRSIYIAVRRNFLSPFMAAFDTPVPFSTMGRRNESNVPAQALILMNDPLVTQLASDWAKQSLKQIPEPTATSRRIHQMYVEAFARTPSEGEIGAASKFISMQANERGVGTNDVELWTDFAHALINTKEFVFLR